MGATGVADRQRGAEAGAERCREAHGGEAGHVPERLQGQRAGSAWVAGAFLGVQGVQRDHERLLEDPGEAAPRAAHQLRASRLREHRHVHPLRAPDARGRRG